MRWCVVKHVKGAWHVLSLDDLVEVNRRRLFAGGDEPWWVVGMADSVGAANELKAEMAALEKRGE